MPQISSDLLTGVPEHRQLEYLLGLLDVDRATTAAHVDVLAEYLAEHPARIPTAVAWLLDQYVLPTPSGVEVIAVIPDGRPAA